MPLSSYNRGSLSDVLDNAFNDLVSATGSGINETFSFGKKSGSNQQGRSMRTGSRRSAMAMISGIDM